jgi:hypothetical protein
MATDQALRIEDGILRIPSRLILGGITDQTLTPIRSERDVRRSGSVTLVIGDDLDLLVLPDADAGVGGTEIDTDGDLLFGGGIGHLVATVLLQIL